MTKSLKIILVVLALISVSFSALYYFNLLPFLKKETTTTGNNNLINQTVNENHSIAIPTQTNVSNDCVILDKENCALGKPIYENNQLMAIGFKLPDGSKIYAPFKGQIEKNSAFLLNGKAYPSLELTDTSKDDWGRSQTRSYFYVTAYSQEPIATETIEKNQSLMTLIETNIEGDYNLILTFREYDVKANQGKTNLDLLKQFFPDLEK